MAFENFMSKTEDVIWLAYKLKFQLGSKISINQMGLYKEVLEGKYCLKGFNRGIDFTILYSDKEFLRISVGEINVSTRYEDKLFVLNELKNAINSIVRNGISLGEPNVFYNIRDEKYMIPNLEYVYADKENYIKSFENKTIFDDAIPEDVIVFDGAEDKYNFIVNKAYYYGKEIYGRDYSIIINGKYINNINVDNMILESLIKENLDTLFMTSNKKGQCEILDKYLSMSGNISDLVNQIRNCTSFATECQLSVEVIEDGNIIQSVSYDNGVLSSYTGVSNLDGCVLNTTYAIDNGIKFETKCDLDSYRYIQELVDYEYKNMYNLINYNSQVKSNNNLLKLVKKMGNK